MFDHYPDMNHDGKVDIYDVATFHELMDEDEEKDQEEYSYTYSRSSNYAGKEDPTGFVIAAIFVIWGIGKLFFFLLDII